MKYLYQRSGGPIISWNRNSAPPQTRAADTVALGSLGGTTLDHPTLVLPAPGAPEPLNGDCGCGCKGAGTCGGGSSAMSGITDTITQNPILAAVGAFLAYKWWKKRKRK